MNTITYDSLANKLKSLPIEVLERVNGYVDAIIEPASLGNKPYKLTSEQQKTLDSQVKLDKNLYVSADVIYEKLKNKYEV